MDINGIFNKIKAFWGNKKILISVIITFIITMIMCIGIYAWDYTSDTHVKVTIKYKDGREKVEKVRFTTLDNGLDFYNHEELTHGVESITVILPEARNNPNDPNEKACYMWWRGTYDNTAICKENGWWQFTEENNITLADEKQQEYNYTDPSDASKRTFTFTPEGGNKQFLYFTYTLWDYEGQTDLPQPGQYTVILGFEFDDEAPKLTVSPTKSELAVSKQANIKWTDNLSDVYTGDKDFYYYASESSTDITDLTKRKYTNGVATTIGKDLDGIYYLWIKNKRDNVHNIATEGAVTAPKLNNEDLFYVVGPYDFRKSFTVTFDDNGGSGGPESVKVKYGEKK